ncbi:hypothetical protein P153DRAFT_371539 [Dothidotthia symphoricarpi CBS 119687]|uniref:Uncharacterized protein n=1 Tax=Dothidotthia symphoricarpi CBS 119687 TaxID=1392245 RepID=A0A6A5ZX86_9PLEO|nr:uncharacterized protein P153DRAFT_371539 [Dothidotthia symphoricarpi CBS 119687]KAF2123635.1 hypothetical protein P153DRAFT_371539 [Dothidotthia symphoricarpi CBS 119687]
MVKEMVQIDQNLGQNTERYDDIERVVEEEAFQLGLGMGQAFAQTDREVKSLGERMEACSLRGKEEVQVQGKHTITAVRAVGKDLQAQGATTMAAVRTIRGQVSGFATDMNTLLRDVRGDVQEGVLAANQGFMTGLSDVSATMTTHSNALRQDVQHLAASSQNLRVDVNHMGTRSDERLTQLEAEFRALTQSFQGARQDVREGFRQQDANTTRGFANAEASAVSRHDEVVRVLERVAAAVENRPPVPNQTSGILGTEPAADNADVKRMMRQMSTSMDAQKKQSSAYLRRLDKALTAVVGCVGKIDRTTKAQMVQMESLNRGRADGSGRLDELGMAQNTTSKKMEGTCAEILALLQAHITLDNSQSDVSTQLLELGLGQNVASKRIGEVCEEMLRLVQDHYNSRPDVGGRMVDLGAADTMASAEIGEVCGEILRLMREHNTRNDSPPDVSEHLPELGAANTTASAEMGRMCAEILRLLQQRHDVNETHHLSSISTQQNLVQDLEAQLAATNQKLDDAIAAQNLITSSHDEASSAYHSAQAIVTSQTSIIATKNEEIAVLQETQRALHAARAEQVEILQNKVTSLHNELTGIKTDTSVVLTFQRHITDPEASEPPRVTNVGLALLLDSIVETTAHFTTKNACLEERVDKLTSTQNELIAKEDKHQRFLHYVESSVDRMNKGHLEMDSVPRWEEKDKRQELDDFVDSLYKEQMIKAMGENVGGKVGDGGL